MKNIRHLLGSGENAGVWAGVCAGVGLVAMVAIIAAAALPAAPSEAGSAASLASGRTTAGASLASNPAPSSASILPGQFSPEIELRIKRVESGLRKAVEIKGRPAFGMALSDRMARYKVPGVGIAVISDRGIEWARGYGFLDVENKIPVTEHGLFQAASISKPVAASAALHFVEHGLLSLDEDVNTKLVSWKVPENKFTAQQKVTLREILSHTAGLTVHGFAGYAAGTPVPTLLQVLNGAKPANSGPIRVDILPGSQFRYAGGGYTVMQQLLIDVVGQPFPEIMAEAVLRPAGMSDSTYEQPLPDARLAQAAVGYDRAGKPVGGRRHVYPEMAAAGLWTTPTDLCRFAIEIMNAYDGRSDKIMSREMARRMLTPVKNGYGLGLGIEGEGEKMQFGHGGANEGFRCQLAAFPGTGMGAAVMTNGDRGGELAAEVLRSIALVYGWERKVVEKTIASIDKRVFADYAGKYEVEKAFALTVSEKDGQLLVQVGEGGEVYDLLPESETSFFSDELGFTLTFVKDAKGKVTSTTVEGLGAKFTAKKVASSK